MGGRNTWGAKLKRTLTAILPIDRRREGHCANCGACCKLPNVCPFLKFKGGKSSCSVHFWRPLNCRKYPRTEAEHITEEKCGYSFSRKRIKKH